jgi:hypothetical protein
VLAVLPRAHWSAFEGTSALRRFHLIEVVQADSFFATAIRIDARILWHLLGVASLDERLVGLVAFVDAPGPLVPSHAAARDRIIDLWPRAQRTAPVMLITGGDRSSRLGVVAAATAAFGVRTMVVRAADFPRGVTESDTLARLLERELVLEERALLIEIEPSDGPEVHANLCAFVDRFTGPLMVSADDAVRVGRRVPLPIVLASDTRDDQRLVWRWALGSDESDALAEDVASHFEVRPDIARSIANELQSSGNLTRDTIWNACREHLRAPLDGLARRIEPAANWADLVVADSELDTLRLIASHVRQRRRVIEEWGFAEKGTRGLGSSALFWGPSGTGKTTAAEVLSRALSLDLYHIDLSQIVSKYIGETERNLRGIFDAAERAGAILLFDEADALFGRRSEVSDSHDRYANIEVSYLLQRMETYRGLAILTTNKKEAIDAAFMRRIRFVVQFPFPDVSKRVELWRRVLPPSMPSQGLEVERLAKLQLSGGSIRNIALAAAFLAAGEESPVRMAHLARAARAELSKLEQSNADAELARWV